MRLLLVFFWLASLGVPCMAQDPVIPADTEIVSLPSGLKYSVLKAGGEGRSPKLGDTVLVHYTGWTTDGKVFDSSHKRGRPASFQLGMVIDGWNEGLTYMTPGATLKFTIPSELGYGKRGSPPNIPPDATLIFEVELIEVTPNQYVVPEFKQGDAEKQRKTESGVVWEYLVQNEQAAKPADDDRCVVAYAFWNTKGQLLQASEIGGNFLEAPITQMQQVTFFQHILPMLREGERVRCEVPPELCFGARDQSPKLPPNSVTVWELELKEIKKPVPKPTFAALDPETTKKTASGLEYQVFEEGTGASPKMGQSVTVHYAGWLEDGTPFDASYDRGQPATFQLGAVIEGWNEGLQLMKEGGSYRFRIPANLAYGSRGAGGVIPPNATLIFHVELIRVGN